MPVVGAVEQYRNEQAVENAKIINFQKQNIKHEIRILMEPKMKFPKMGQLNESVGYR